MNYVYYYGLKYLVIGVGFSSNHKHYQLRNLQTNRVITVPATQTSPT